MLLAVLLPFSAALFFEMYPFQTTCFHKHLSKNEITTIAYDINPLTLLKFYHGRRHARNVRYMTMNVYDAEGVAVLESSVKEAGEVKFTPTADGTYEFCFVPAREQRHIGCTWISLTSGRGAEDDSARTAEHKIIRLASRVSNRARSILSQHKLTASRYTSYDRNAARCTHLITVMSALTIGAYVTISFLQVKHLKKHFAQHKL